MQKSSEYPISPGSPSPLGSCKKGQGINFALFSEHATAVILCLFHPEEKKPFLEIELDPDIHKTEKIWHVLISNLPVRIEYAYRLDGPFDPAKGLLFNLDHLLSDPYAKSLNAPFKWGEKKLKAKDFALKGRLIDLPPFDWGNDTLLRIPLQDLIIYEMHVRGLTQHRSSHAKNKGSYLGVIEKIPHFKKLGVNAVELLPIHEFNEMENCLINPYTHTCLFNYWGYSTINFFCPMNRYASSDAWGQSALDFKTMVKELHKNQIEVILDVVYNHTAESDSIDTKYYSFKGIDNPVYYYLDAEGSYVNYSGCGNTFNTNHPVAAELILESLRYWIEEMHVDGFRFDLAAILSRDIKGNPTENSPIIEAILSDPVISKVKLIAEPWDAAALYQVGSFPGKEKWAEWNGKYRDIVRNFIKGTDGQAGDFARSLCGSDNLYLSHGTPCHSINFVTAHDGYTLRDLVSYMKKHNLSNGEKNKDGYDHNFSWNCGVEGKTQNKEIQHLRARQMRNFHLALMVSLGTPMMVMGDEYGHTRNGNNNTWGHDDELNWFLWDELEDEEDFFRFHRLTTHFRKAHSCLRRDTFLTNEDVSWHGHQPLHPDWSLASRFVAYILKDKEAQEDLYIAFNANYKEAPITLPPLENKNWFRVIETSLPSPEDFIEDPRSLPPIPETYVLPPYSSLVLKALL